MNYYNINYYKQATKRLAFGANVHRNSYDILPRLTFIRDEKSWSLHLNIGTFHCWMTVKSNEPDYGEMPDCDDDSSEYAAQWGDR